MKYDVGTQFLKCCSILKMNEHSPIHTHISQKLIIGSGWTQNIQSKSLRAKTNHKFLTSYLTLALCHEKKLTMITRFNGFLRVYDDIFLSRFEEYKLDAVPKKASLSSETFVYSYHIEEDKISFSLKE